MSHQFVSSANYWPACRRRRLLTIKPAAMPRTGAAVNSASDISTRIVSISTILPPLRPIVLAFRSLRGKTSAPCRCLHADPYTIAPVHDCPYKLDGQNRTMRVTSPDQVSGDALQSERHAAVSAQRISRSNARWRTAGVAVIVLVVIVVMALACSNEPEPTPTPTPVPPTATPTPIATPIPTATPALMLSMADFVIDESTTGQELIDRLSGEEQACVRAGFGESIYNIILVTPLLLGGSDPTAAAPL